MRFDSQISESLLLNLRTISLGESGKPLAVYVRPDSLQVEGLLRATEHEFPVLLLSKEPTEDIVKASQHIVARRADAEPGLFIETSGTTGKPKIVFIPRRRLWDSTLPTHEAKIWGLTFPPYKMAGLQVIAQSISSGSQLVAPEPELSPLQKLEEFGQAGVQAVSGTPTFWRLANSYTGPLQHSLRYITLGGEIADQRLLDFLAGRFPKAKISHVYATSETGAVFSVSDGLAGFPVDYVGKLFRNGKSMTIIQGQIVVNLPSSNEQVSTGDFVVRSEGRYLFDGRAGTHINVAGHKVSLTAVEQCALQFEGVLDCQAYGMSNPFTGQSVFLKVMWTSENLEQGLLAHLRKTLPRPAVPALIETVTEFTVNESQKKGIGGPLE